MSMISCFASNDPIFDPFLDFSRSFNGTGYIPPPRADEVSSFAGAHVNWKETAEAHVFKADLPGVKKEELKIEVEDGTVLKISGERKREEEEEETDHTWHRLERSSGKFTRRFRLPENAKVDRVKAAMEDGVLTMTVPKEAVKKQDVKSIEISG